MLSIQTNVNSLVAQQNLSVTSAFQSKTIQQLTSGYRINQSGDDAAGLAVANKFRSTIAELTQGVANGNDATAQLQIMDGGMNNISQILDRLKTLATQSASGTFTGNRTTLNSEFQNDLLEIDRQAQSIGLNTGGSFSKNLDVYLGAGSGSSSLQNGVVTLGLTQSSVDSQSLGMRGMEAVNLTSGSLAGTNAGIDIGSTSATSVQNIVGNISGVNSNQQATAGYAAMQFSGAGFADAGKVGVAVNLAGVTDVTTLVAAVNTAIQSAGNGTTAAATAFKNANITASVHTDSAGGQQLAFTSSTSAFQVQAGDQMANALLGNVAVVGGVAKGISVAADTATKVTGAITTDGNFASTQKVKLVITGGGLAGPVTLQVNTGASGVTTSGAITDLQNQFSGSAGLQAAGLSMSGSSTTGGQLSFNSASGQGFNIQVSGDTANLLGLGSFSADSSGNSDYAKITAGTAYSASTVTGSATTTGLAAGLEVSLNGQASTALTGIDLTAGPSAVAAKATSSGSIGSGAVDITSANQNLNITVTNNGVATTKAITLSTNQVASNGTVASTIAGLTNSATFAGYTASAAAHNDTFTVAVDGGAAQNVTVDGTFAAGASGAADFMTALQSAVAGKGLSAGWDASTKELTFKSGTAGANSSVALGAATYKSSASAWVTTTSANIVTGPITVASASNNNKFALAVDGAASVTLTVADGVYNTAAGFLTAITNAVSNAGLAADVTVGWDAAFGDRLTFTNVSTGAASSLAVSASAGNTGLTNIGFIGGSTNHGSDTAANNGLATFGLNANTTAVQGTIDAPTTVQSIATQIQTAFGAAAKVTVTNDNKLSIESNTKGANSAVVVNTPGTFSANATLNLTLPTSVSGQNSSIADVVNNLNAQFASNSNYQAAGLQAVATASDGTGSGNYVSIQSTNGTQFRLNAVGVPAAATAGTLASTVTSAGISVGSPLTLGATNQFKVAVDGAAAVEVTVGAAAPYTDATTFLAAVNTAIKATTLGTSVTAGWDATSGKLTLTSATTGSDSSLTLSAGTADGLAKLGFVAAATNSGHQVQVTENTGFGVAGSSFTAAAASSTGTKMSTLAAFGISNSTALTFSAMKFGTDKQALTFSATDSNGVLETKTITLQNNASTNRAGVSIDDAVSYINQQLQQSTGSPALQKIVAVKQANAAGTAEDINFVSSLSNFTVGVGSTANADGVNGGTATQSFSQANGSGANMSVDTQAGGKAAITAIAAAVAKLGSAQAAVGKGQNQLNYAVSLAQSQITNFSAAESQIRDANVAQQAANLSKAQVLSQASIAAMAQANSAPQAVLALLRG